MSRGWLDDELARVLSRRDGDLPSVQSRPLTSPLALANASTSALTYSSKFGYNGPALTDADVRRIEKDEA